MPAESRDTRRMTRDTYASRCPHYNRRRRAVIRGLRGGRGRGEEGGKGEEGEGTGGKDRGGGRRGLEGEDERGGWEWRNGAKYGKKGDEGIKR